jgi:hypothetical protein
MRKVQRKISPILEKFGSGLYRKIFQMIFFSEMVTVARRSGCHRADRGSPSSRRIAISHRSQLAISATSKSEEKESE